MAENGEKSTLLLKDVKGIDTSYNREFALRSLLCILVSWYFQLHCPCVFI
uniref:Uncharacterized protein n=1 Tax=Anguilla anguilla TaxID=7936 RepID=A0A0E9X5I1_ANGAN